MGRAPCCDKAKVKKGPWSPEEDAILKSYIEKFGTGGNWIALPQKIGLKRCGKSCRLRWLNYLRPNIKHGGFSEEEENIICSLYLTIGSRWSVIAAQLPERTDNDIKNYWNTKLKKKLLQSKQRKDQTARAVSCLNQHHMNSESEYTNAADALGFYPHFSQPMTMLPSSNFHRHPPTNNYQNNAESSTNNAASSTMSLCSQLPNSSALNSGLIANDFASYDFIPDLQDEMGPYNLCKWEGLESFGFSGLDLVSRSTVTTSASPENTSFDDINSLICCPVFSSNEICQNATPPDCALDELRALSAGGSSSLFF